MKRTIIVAMAKDRAIGKDNDLMWHLPDDMRFFRETTTGHTVVMGRKNWDSIPRKYRPLPNRTNVVLTRQDNYYIDDAIVAHRLKDAVIHAEANGEDVCFIIGGGEIYKLALAEDMVDEMFITVVDGLFVEADTHFPDFKEEKWEKTLIRERQKDDKHEYGFSIFHFVKKV